MTGIIVDATLEHCDRMAPRLREADRLEVVEVVDLAPAALLRKSVERSSAAFTWLIDGEPACMWGVVSPSIVGDTGHPWLLTTPLILRDRRKFWTGSKFILGCMLDEYRRLEVAIDVRYEASLRWAARLGFVFDRTEPLGIMGRPFHHFYVEGG